MGALVCVLTGFYGVSKGIYPLDIKVYKREIWGVLKVYGYNSMVQNKHGKYFNKIAK